MGEETTKGEIEGKIAEIEKENEESAEEIKSFKKHHHMVAATQCIWSLISAHAMKPDESSYCRSIAAFISMFVLEENNSLSLINKELSQLDVISNAAWNQCLICLKEITSEKVNAFNPNEIDSFDVVFIEKLIDGINTEEIGNEGLALIMTMLYQFVDSSCKLYKHVEEEKMKRAQEEKEKKTDASDTKKVEEEEET